jgi:dinuclear metal center YbgI/SA1388 family protein
MADRDEIVRFCDALLQPGEFKDYCPNGLQVPGRRAVTRIVSGVSATLELFEAALEREADMVLAHHGVFWGNTQDALTEQQAARLRALLTNEISLVAYHLPLDAHAEIGNNALLCELLGLERAEPFSSYNGGPIGWVGRPPEPIAPGELEARIAERLGRDPLFFKHGPDAIASVGIISGGAASNFPDAITAGVDAFLTGEPREPVMAESREAGIHFIAAGHYATETLGIRALGDKLATELHLTHEFIDLPNPI